jgi:hypothetical protein
MKREVTWLILFNKVQFSLTFTVDYELLSNSPKNVLTVLKTTQCRDSA